ncbi:MAG TPA: hypothetical protein ACFCUY_04225 [Xenococcaceae cyanobacterium]
MKSQHNSGLIPFKSTLNYKLSRMRSWQIALEATAKSNWWQMFLIAVGSASSVIYPHVPLVGFAAVAGNTLTRNKALISAMSIWFANQLYGFAIRAYPKTLESLMWGLVMGLGILAVTWLVTLQPKFSRRNFRGYLIWLAISFISSYAIYQGSIVLVAQWMGGHGFSSAILWGIFLKNFIWAMALFGVYGCILLRHQLAYKAFPSQLKN